jgi:EAL domain-containing protein (putative c-di-GMP-specific phosphodiesterase class I)
MTQPAFLDAILVDEVGIESGSLDGILLKSAYQPVFSPRGENLQITGFDASTVVWREDTEFDLSQLSEGALPDPDFLAGLCQRLSVDNYRNLDIAGRDLFLDHALAGNRHLQDSLLDAARLARSVGEETLVPGQVICRISQAAFLADADDLARLEALREAGMRIMLDAFDHDLDTAHSQRRFVPDIAEIGAAWFGKIAERGAAAGERHACSYPRHIDWRTPRTGDRLGRGISVRRLSRGAGSCRLPHRGSAQARRGTPVRALRRAAPACLTRRFSFRRPSAIRR